MPQINSATPIYLEQRVGDEFFATRKTEHRTKSVETPPKFNFVSEAANDYDEDFLSQATENDSCDSAFSSASDEKNRLISGCDPNVISVNATEVTENESVDSGCLCGSDEEGRLNSGLSFVSDEEDRLNSVLSFVSDGDNRLNSGSSSVSDEEDLLNSLLSSVEGCTNKVTIPNSQLKTTDSFDFWNKTSIGINHIKLQSDKKSDKNSITKSIANCTDHDIQTSSSDDVGDLLNLLTGNLNEKNSDFKSKSLSNVENQTVPTQKSLKQETANNSDIDFSLSDLLNVISDKLDNKMVNSISIQRNLSNEKICNNNLSDECFNSSNNLSSEIDNTYSDLFSSVCLNDNSKILLSAENNYVNTDKLENFFGCNNSLLSPGNDESLSDLLASICVESTINNEKNNSLLSNNTAIINAKSNDVDASDISLASLAEEYLSSKASNCFLSTSRKDDYIDLTENILLNTDKIPLKNPSLSGNENTQESFDMSDFFAAVNEKHDNSDQMFLGDKSNDSALKPELSNLMSQTKYSTNVDEVALFAEKYINEDESSEDETSVNIEIDLTSCLKSDKPTSLPLESLSITTDEIHIEENSDLSPLHSPPPLLIQDTSEIYSPLLKSKSTKSKPSLLSKALSCKPKKDREAVLKVLSMQKQICERLFNPPQLADVIKKPKKSAVYPAGDFMYSTIGRRAFEHGKFHEVR